MLDQWSRDDDLDELDWEPGAAASASPLRVPLVDADEVGAPSRVAAILVVVVIGAVIAALFLDSPGSESPTRDPSTAEPSTGVPSTALPSTGVPSTALPPTAVPSTAAPDSLGPAGEPESSDAGIAWPAPPVDHDPIVTGRPGYGPLLGAATTDLSVVYVNTLGRPTVIDLDTGTYREVLVAETRAGDVFSVEHGAVVGRPGSRNLAEGSARAVSVHVYRTVADPPGELVPAPGAGPILCLDEAACASLGWRGNEFVRGADTVSLLGTSSAPEVAAFLSADRWTVEGRWWSAGDVRIPTPSGGDVWVIHQPGD